MFVLAKRRALPEFKANLHPKNMENSIEIKQEKKPMRTAIKILIIAIILIFLVFLSIGIVKIVPKALNSLATASLSIGNVFSGDSSTTTNSGSVATPAATSTSGGFSIRDLTNPHGTTTQNWVPAPAGTNSSNNANNNSNMGHGISSTSTSSSNSSSNSYSNTSAGSNAGNTTNAYAYTLNESGQASNPHYRTVGPSDMAVIITAQGIISKTTGQFVQTNNFTTDDMVVIKFKIENRGLYATGPWSARVDMPSNDAADKVRTLGPINSLYAGSAITGEARFDNPIAGNQVVTINVDTAMGTQDGNRSNNIATAPIYTTGANYGGTYNPGGAADLQLTILQTGTVDAYGQFIANSYPRIGQKVAVRFQVTNVGGTTVPAWAWRADLSGSTYNTYTTAEAALAPGQSSRIIVGFDTINYGASTMTITADSNNQIYEANESNNTGAITVNVGY